jgi:hypothetical protein
VKLPPLLLGCSVSDFADSAFSAGNLAPNRDGAPEALGETALALEKLRDEDE